MMARRAAARRRRGGGIPLALALVRGPLARTGEGAAAAAGVALIALLAAVDLAIGKSAVLIPLLVVGPLAAAVRASARLTAAVAALALAVAIVLGPFNGVPFTGAPSGVGSRSPVPP